MTALLTCRKGGAGRAEAIESARSLASKWGGNWGVYLTPGGSCKAYGMSVRETRNMPLLGYWRSPSIATLYWVQAV